MSEAADSETPAISRRIKATRERLQEQWKAEHPGEKGNPFTQAEVASRIGHEEGTDPPPSITLGAYGAFERFREPSFGRLRQIARAFNLDEDYFSPSGDLASATAKVEAEADRLTETNNDLRELIAALRALLPDPPSPPTGDAP